MRGLFTASVARFVQRHPGLYAAYVAAMLLHPVEKLVLPYAFSQTLETVKTGGAATYTRSLVTLLVMWIVAQLLQLGFSMAETTMHIKYTAAARTLMVDRFMESVRCDYDPSAVARIVPKLYRVPDTLRAAFGTVHHMLVTDVIMHVSSAVMYALISRTIGTVYVCGVLTWGALLYGNFRTCGASWSRRNNSFEELQMLMSDILDNTVTVLSAGTKAREIARIEEKSREVHADIEVSLRCSRLFRALIILLMIATFSAIMVATVRGLTNETIAFPQFLYILLTIFPAITRFVRGHSIVTDLHASFALIRGADAALATDRAACRLAAAEDTKRSAAPGLRVIGVEKDGYTRRPYTIAFPRGTVYTLDGDVGHGKSTLLRCIMRFTTFDRGIVLFEGRDIQAEPVAQWRRRVGYLPQNPPIFDRTLRENIEYGGYISFEEGVAAMRRFQLHEIADAFERKRDERVGKHGHALSGGQRQLVHLLRLIGSRRPVLLLDEPFSAMDAYTRKCAREMLEVSVLPDQTVILVTHTK